MADRSIIYPGAVPLETDLLFAQQAGVVALSKLAAALFGTGTVANGFAVTQTAVASMNVQVAPGEIYQNVNLEATAYSSLPADTTHSILKQGISLDTVLLALAAPGTVGFSINYLIQATFAESDSVPVVLPYYNASNPFTAFSGPANAGTAQNTRRLGKVTLTAKAGVAATTGTQVTPAPDTGNVGLYVVTVANGAVTVVNANISPFVGSPIITPALNGRLLNIQTFTASGTYTPTPGTTKVKVKVLGGGGAGGGAASTAAGNLSGGVGGGAGSYAESMITTAFAGVTVTVGAGGVGVAAAAGGAGGTSSFGALVSAPGGSAGGLLGNSVPPIYLGRSGNASVATGGSILNAEGAGGGPLTGPLTTFVTSGEGGASVFGGGAGPRGSTGAGVAAVTKGSGGSGAAALPSNPSTFAGGNGAPGIVIVEEYA